MKHTLKVTLILVGIFLLVQLIGLSLVKLNGVPQVDETTGEVLAVTYQDTGTVKSMEIDKKESTIMATSLLIAILIATAIIFLLARFKVHRVWKVWFAVVIVIGLYKAFNVVLTSFVPLHQLILGGIALLIAMVLAYYRVFRPNPFVHNFTELFVYGGIAVILVQIINLYAMVVLLLLVAVYDMIAVWKSKHMIKLAHFQMDTKAFAGLSIPYKLEAPAPPKKVRAAGKKTYKTVEVKSAILGGGDMGFPLFFSAAVMETYNTFPGALLVTAFTTIALFLLLYFAKKDRFYPAMPFITAGCLVGWGALWLLITFV
jgi:presenilin-like A22 family membrane protease